MSERASVATSREGLVGIAELRRPPHNLLDADTLRELADALDALSAECRGMVVAAEGRSFSAGANFASASTTFEAGLDPGEALRRSARAIYAQAERIFAMPRPIVAAVHGAAIGAGLGLALACDVRVACSDAFFAANFVRLGIHPGFALSHTLPALVGPGRAADMMLTGRRVYGEEALAMGLVDRLVDAADVRKTAVAVAAEIAAAAPLAVTATRATLRRGSMEHVRAAFAHEVEEQARLAQTADAAEGISAMLQRRDPHFTER